MSIKDKTIDDLVQLICAERPDPQEVRRALLDFAKALGPKEPASLPLVHSDEEVRFEHILVACASVWGVSVSDLRGKIRRRKYTEPRCAAVYLARIMLPEVTLMRLGGALGGRDHTTVIYSYRRAEEKMGLVSSGDLDRNFRERVALARTMLEPAVAGNEQASSQGDNPRQLRLAM